MSPFDSASLAYCKIDGTLIFLDIANDRYFRLPEDRNGSMVAEFDRMGEDLWHQPTSLPQSNTWIPPARASTAIASGAFRLSDVASAIWIQQRVERRLASQSFAYVLSVLHSLSRTHTAHRTARSNSLEREVRAFEYAKLLRSAADRCLPRSIALALRLVGNEVPAHVVIGVKLAPFGAHCWVQAGDEVLNDSIEEVLRYQPILVI